MRRHPPAASLRGAAWLLGAWLCCAAPVAAQTLDDIELRTQADAQVLRIRFNAAVRYLQLLPTESAAAYTLRFEVLGGDDSVLRQTTEEFRRVAAAGARPELTVSYVPDPGSTVKQLTLRLAQPWSLQARQGNNSRSIELVAATATATAPATPALPVAPAVDQGPAAAVGQVPAAAGDGAAVQAETERRAAELMAQARKALAAQDADTAINALNALLKLPPNAQSETAQEAIGQAWELAGSVGRARIEDDLYLKLYPQGEGAARVAQRLQALGGAAPVAADGATAVRKDLPSAFAGSIAQYYYGGKARSKSLVSIATGIDQATLSRTTESAIVTSVDLSGRRVGEGSETRVVLRGSGSTNLLSGGHSESSISAAYLDHRLGADGLALRVGRQSPISGGLLGLFDGVSLAYPLQNGLKIDVMGGVPANALVSAPGERLFATVVEADGLAERWGGNAYLLEQSTEGITNRRGLGAELRYAGDIWSLNTVVDYDALFKMWNAVSVHGSVQAGGQTTVTLLVDTRRAPSLELTNALISSGAASLKDLLQSRSLEQVKADALATSAIARQFLVSVGRPLSPKWQLAVDLRYSAIGALPAVGDFEATPATGAQYTVTGQLTGTNLYSRRDIHNFNVSVTTTPFFKGLQLAYNNVTGLYGDNVLTVEPSLRLYTQTDQQDVRLVRVGPGLRMTYKHSRRASLLGEMLYEASRTSGPINHDNTQSVFFYVGYRYELF